MICHRQLVRFFPFRTPESNTTAGKFYNLRAQKMRFGLQFHGKNYFGVGVQRQRCRLRSAYPMSFKKSWMIWLSRNMPDKRGVGETMPYCAALGFPIEICGASRTHPLCRRCLAQEDTKPHPAGKRNPWKRCECGRSFSPTNNSQRFCEKCRAWNETLKNREYQARFREKMKRSPRVRVESQNS